MTDSFKIKTIRAGDKALEVTHTEKRVESYTLVQIDQTIANIKQELANAQARLDYQLMLKAQLEVI